MSQDPNENSDVGNASLEAEDFLIDANGNLVFTAKFLRKRGYCCGNGCRFCPYPES